MPIVVAVLDANLLVPIVACDFLLTAFEHHLFEPMVSSVVLDEVERTLVQDFPHLDPHALRRRVEHMRAALDDQTVDAEVVDGVPDTINAKDRHVIATALAVEAAVVVTNDAALRSEIAESDLDLEPLDGAAFAMLLWEASPADVGEVIDALIAKRRRRPVTPAEMADQLRVHFPAMADAWLEVQRGVRPPAAD